MELSALDHVNNALLGGRSLFLYSGSFHDEHTAKLISMGEQFVDQENGVRALRNKVGFLMVESYQNIIRHRVRSLEEQDRKAGRSMFLIRHQGLSFEVVAVNAVPNNEAGPLTKLLENVSELGPDQLKRMFLSGLQNDSSSKRGGAGLGLIEMARRSGHDLVHHMVSIGADHQRYALRVFIGDNELPRFSDSEIDELHDLVATEDILLLCKGRCTDKLHQTVVEMISKDLDEGFQRIETWTKCYQGATELLKVVGKKDPEALFLIQRVDQGHSFVLGTDMEHADAGALETTVNALNELSGVQLQEHVERLYSGEQKEGEIRSSGLLELAHRKVAPLKLHRTPKGDTEFVVIEVVA
ncbi:MAG: SiaB family protein kinase [Flavobacteriales bacterium]|nr:SiaB family protein kinase [Flavobacteriales bacterium]